MLRNNTVLVFGNLQTDSADIENKNDITVRLSNHITVKKFTPCYHIREIRENCNLFFTKEVGIQIDRLFGFYVLKVSSLLWVSLATGTAVLTW